MKREQQLNLRRIEMQDEEKDILDLFKFAWPPMLGFIGGMIVLWLLKETRIIEIDIPNVVIVQFELFLYLFIILSLILITIVIVLIEIRKEVKKLKSETKKV